MLYNYNIVTAPDYSRAGTTELRFQVHAKIRKPVAAVFDAVPFPHHSVRGRRMR